MSLELPHALGACLRFVGHGFNRAAKRLKNPGFSRWRFHRDVNPRAQRNFVPAEQPVAKAVTNVRPLWHG
jgi:hypothetical protein